MSSIVEINCRHDIVNIFLGPLLQALSIARVQSSSTVIYG